MTLTVSREGQRLRLQAQGASDNWRVLLRGIEAVTSVENGTVEMRGLGMLVLPDSGTEEVGVWL